MENANAPSRDNAGTSKPFFQESTSTMHNTPWETASSDSWTDTGSEDDYIVQSDSDDDLQKSTQAISKPKSPQPSNLRKCFKCKKQEDDTSEPLKHCAICKKILYCSRECQKEDWQSHKPKCVKAHLQDLTEKEAFSHLIDAYRLRVEDEYVMNGDVYSKTLYGGGNPLRHFYRYLDKAELRNNVLPSWWNVWKRTSCEEMAKDWRQNVNIYAAVEKSDIIEHYGDPFMPMNLRVLAEKIYGKSVIG